MEILLETIEYITKCDNQAIVSVLTSGRTQDRILAAIARNILLELAACDIELKVIHVLGKNNPVADLYLGGLSQPIPNKN